MQLDNNVLAALGEVPSRIDRAHLAAADVSNPDKTGILKKLSGGGILRSWQRRYFILKDAFLYYYKTESDERPYNYLNLCDYTKCESASEMKGIKKKGAFYLKNPGNSRLKVYVFVGNNEAESKEWMEAIQTNIKVCNERTPVITIHAFFSTLSCIAQHSSTCLYGAVVNSFFGQLLFICVTCALLMTSHSSITIPIDIDLKFKRREGFRSEDRFLLVKQFSAWIPAYCHSVLIPLELLHPPTSPHPKPHNLPVACSLILLLTLLICRHPLIHLRQLSRCLRIQESCLRRAIQLPFVVPPWASLSHPLAPPLAIPRSPLQFP